jgi:hypothetical protein
MDIVRNRGSKGMDRCPLQCCLTAVFVDSISTSMASDIDPGLDAITYVWGNQCSQVQRQLCRLGMGGWEIVCMTFALLISQTAGSIVVSTCRQVY